MSLPGASLHGHGSAQDPGMGGGRVPKQEGSSSCPSPGAAAPSPPLIAKFMPDGRPRLLVSFLLEAWCLCLNGKGGNFFDILDLATWKLGGVRAIRNETREEVMKASPLASGPGVFSEPRLVNSTISRCTLGTVTWLYNHDHHPGPELFHLLQLKRHTHESLTPQHPPTILLSVSVNLTTLGTSQVGSRNICPFVTGLFHILSSTHITHIRVSFLF